MNLLPGLGGRGVELTGDVGQSLVPALSMKKSATTRPAGTIIAGDRAYRPALHAADLNSTARVPPRGGAAGSEEESY